MSVVQSATIHSQTVSAVQVVEKNIVSVCVKPVRKLSPNVNVAKLATSTRTPASAVTTARKVRTNVSAAQGAVIYLQAAFARVQSVHISRVTAVWTATEHRTGATATAKFASTPQTSVCAAGPAESIRAAGVRAARKGRVSVVRGAESILVSAALAAEDTKKTAAAQ